MADSWTHVLEYSMVSLNQPAPRGYPLSKHKEYEIFTIPESECAIIFIYFSRKARWILWLKQILLKYAISASVKIWMHSYTKGQNIILYFVDRASYYNVCK